MKTPMLRFKADDGSDFPTWEEKMLGKIIREYREYHEKDGTYEHVSLTKDGVISKTERYDRDYLVKCVDKKYRVTHMNDICYNPANLKFGVICRNTYGDGIFSPIYVTYRVNESYDPIFIEALVVRDAFIQQALRFQEGTVYERMSVSPSDFESMFVSVPSLPEQRKIADLLSAVDDVISAQEAEVAAWEKRKKGVMQKLFSQEVRFKADDGSEFPAWEKKKFGDIWKRVVVKNDGSFGGDKIISVANMKWAPKDDVRDDYLKTYNLLPSNAIAFEGNRNNSYSYGRFVLNDIGEGIVSHVFVCFEPIADIISAFWKEYIHAECVMGNILRKCTKSSTMMHDLVVPDFLKQIIFVPSLPEQRKIADCLILLDDVIAKAKDELDAWRELKKGLLQQMFV